eukprot:8997762-Alexandrium_andersonii.AAC.1
MDARRSKITSPCEARPGPAVEPRGKAAGTVGGTTEGCWTGLSTADRQWASGWTASAAPIAVPARAPRLEEPARRAWSAAGRSVRAERRSPAGARGAGPA